MSVKTRSTKKFAITIAIALVAGVGGIAGSAAAAGPEPYADPPFGAGCTWHRYDDGNWADLALLREKRLCVEYSKRDITVSNGGAILFLLAEPSRFAVALPACQYWQRDHWRFRVTPSGKPLLSWDGSYWFDKANGSGGVRLSNFKLAGSPVGIADAAATLRPTLPRVAEALTRYGEQDGESGLSLDLPAGAPCQA